MLKEDRKFLVWAASLLAGFFFVLPSLYAQEPGVYQSSVREDQVRKRVAYWRNLKEKNPAAFDRLARSAKTQIQEKFSSLKERNPGNFKALQGRYLEHRRERLERLREERPEAFGQLMQRRTERLHQWRGQSPERYQKFLENHPRIAQKIEKGNLFSGPPKNREDLFQRAQAKPEQHRREPETVPGSRPGSTLVGRPGSRPASAPANRQDLKGVKTQAPVRKEIAADRNHRLNDRLNLPRSGMGARPGGPQGDPQRVAEDGRPGVVGRPSSNPAGKPTQNLAGKAGNAQQGIQKNAPPRSSSSGSRGGNGPPGGAAGRRR